jgi:hypothetical protein
METPITPVPTEDLASVSAEDLGSAPSQQEDLVLALDLIASLSRALVSSTSVEENSILVPVLAVTTPFKKIPLEDLALP